MTKRTLLLLRSYGDFAVAICTYGRYASEDRNISLYASAHLRPLYDSLQISQAGIRLPRIEFVDWGIRHQILSIFTNRFLFSLISLAECRRIGRFCNSDTGLMDDIWLEQKKRHRLFNLFTGIQTQYVHNGIMNIYDAYAYFWGAVPVKQHRPVASVIHKVLVLPGSRKPEKRLPMSLISQIRSKTITVNGAVIVAGLRSEMEAYEGELHIISSFDELIRLIRESDFIHCADSVAAHLCELFEKPHRVYYNKAINLPWATPGGELFTI